MAVGYSRAVSQIGAKMEQKTIFDKRPKLDEAEGSWVKKRLAGKPHSDFACRNDGKGLLEFCNVRGFKPTIQ
jgi:hypothetical protein